MKTMPLSPTRDKLSEAAYFLARFRETDFGEKAHLYLLSAFISSARSVLWVMRHEYSKTPGWSEWFAAKQPKREQARMLRAITELRNATEKQGEMPLQLRIELRLPAGSQSKVAFSELKKAKRVKLVAFSPGEPAPDGHLVGTITRRYFTTAQNPGAPILSTCKRYFKYLQE